MEETLYFLLIGVGIGAVYAIAALSMTLLFNGSGLLNWAQGDFIMVGALSTVVLQNKGVPYLAALGAAVFITAVLAVGIGLLFSIPLRKEGYDLDLVMLAGLGVAFVLSNAAAALFGRATYSIPSPLAGMDLAVGSLQVPMHYFLLIATAILLYVVSQLIYTRTDKGLLLRAVALDTEAARYSGVSISMAVVLIWAISGVAGGLGGVLIGSVSYVTPYMGLRLTVMGVAGAMIGGLYSPLGAMIGGMVIGVAESFAGAYFTGAIREIVAPCIIIMVLVLRPRGMVSVRKSRTV
jgi:branched-chain amino acid transport system permease protein